MVVAIAIAMDGWDGLDGLWLVMPFWLSSFTSFTLQAAISLRLA